jgi:hypothetical protein
MQDTFTLAAMKNNNGAMAPAKQSNPSQFTLMQVIILILQYLEYGPISGIFDNGILAASFGS